MLIEKAGAESKGIIEQVLDPATDVEFAQFFTEYAAVLNGVSSILIEVDNAGRVIKALDHARSHTHIGVVTADNGCAAFLVVNGRRRHQQFVDVGCERQAVVIVHEDFQRRACLQVRRNKIAFCRFAVAHLRADVGNAHAPIELGVLTAELGAGIGVECTHIYRYGTTRLRVGTQNVRSAREVRVDETTGDATAESVAQFLAVPHVQAELSGLEIADGCARLVREGDVAQAEVATKEVQIQEEKKSQRMQLKVVYRPKDEVENNDLDAELTQHVFFVDRLDDTYATLFDQVYKTIIGDEN